MRAVVVVGIVVVIMVRLNHGLLPSWKASSASEKDRTISSRPGTGTRTFSLRTSEMPERRETMNSVGILQAARLCAELDLFRRAHRLGDNVVAGETKADQRADRGVSHRANARTARPAESA